jgi:hypothetical protein
MAARDTVRIDVNQVSDGIEKTFRELDEARAAALGELAEVSAARLNVRQRDRDRLAAKLGEDHPRVAATAQAVAFGRSLLAELKLEQQAAAAKPIVVDERSWALHGVVLDAERQPQPGLTVAVGPSGAPPAQTVTATTDEHGYFGLKGLVGDESRRQPLSVRVLRRGRLLRTSDAGLTPRAGRSEFREIVVTVEAEPAPPPRRTKKRTPRE